MIPTAITIAIVMMSAFLISAPSSINAAGAQALTSTKLFVTISDPTKGETVVAGRINVTGHASPYLGSIIKSVDVRIDSGGYARATNLAGDWSSWVLVGANINSGQHRIVARVTDRLGGSAYAIIDVTAVVTPNVQPDSSGTTPPTITITSPVSGTIVNESKIIVTGTAQDSGSGIQAVEVQINRSSYKLATPDSANNWSTWHATFDMSSQQVGQYIIQARATDKAGNKNWADTAITNSLYDNFGSTYALSPLSTSPDGKWYGVWNVGGTFGTQVD